jgi:hypothetical protein
LSLTETGNLAEACQAFAESARLDVAGGTLFRLAQCREAEGRTASAWAVYQEALSEALKRGNAEKAAEVRAHLERLEPRLVKLRVVLSSDLRALDGLTVSRNGTILGPPAWGVALPIDPGRVEVLVQAKGLRPATAVVVAHEGDGIIELPIPNLEPLADPRSAVPAMPARETGPPPLPNPVQVQSHGRGPLMRTLGWVTIGASSAAFAASLGLQLRSSSLVREATPFCPNGCDGTGHNLYESAGQSYWASVGAAIAGVGLVGLGAVLVWTAPNDARTTVTVGPAQLQIGRSF